IRRTTDFILQNPKDLIEYIDKGTPRDQVNRRPDLEYVFSYLINHQMNIGSILEAQWAKRLSPETRIILVEKATQIVEQLIHLKDVIKKNPGISPLAMNSLYNYFHNRE